MIHDLDGRKRRFLYGYHHVPATVSFQTVLRSPSLGYRLAKAAWEDRKQSKVMRLHDMAVVVSRDVSGTWEYRYDQVTNTLYLNVEAFARRDHQAQRDVMAAAVEVFVKKETNRIMGERF